MGAKLTGAGFGTDRLFGKYSDSRPVLYSDGRYEKNGEDCKQRKNDSLYHDLSVP
jgi:hypothetical protein